MNFNTKNKFIKLDHEKKNDMSNYDYKLDD